LNNLFQLSSVSYDVVNIKREHIHVVDLISNARKKHDYLNPNNQLRVRLDQDFTNPNLAVYGNKNLLETALINIFDNASKFSSHDVVNMEVSIDEENLVIKVTDSGVGIPPEDIPKITQPFFRADNVRQIPGTGIGIPLTLRIVQIHNGSLDVKSELNKGTTVTIVLPLVLNTEAEVSDYSAERTFN
jgi:signal transduction histidine kinase